MNWAFHLMLRIVAAVGLTSALLAGSTQAQNRNQGPGIAFQERYALIACESEDHALALADRLSDSFDASDNSSWPSCVKLMVPINMSDIAVEPRILAEYLDAKVEPYYVAHFQLEGPDVWLLVWKFEGQL